MDGAPLDTRFAYTSVCKIYVPPWCIDPVVARPRVVQATPCQGEGPTIRLLFLLSYAQGAWPAWLGPALTGAWPDWGLPWLRPGLTGACSDAPTVLIILCTRGLACLAGPWPACLGPGLPAWVLACLSQVYNYCSYILCTRGLACLAGAWPDWGLP